MRTTALDFTPYVLDFGSDVLDFGTHVPRSGRVIWAKPPQPHGAELGRLHEACP